MAKKAYIIATIISLIPLLFLVYGYTNQEIFFASQESVRQFIEPWGIFAPLGFIIVQIAQVILTPINHYVIGIAGGFIFGSVTGSLLNWVGRVVGHTIAFAIARHLARPLVLKILPKKALEKYDKYVSGSAFLLFLAYFLPFFPDDELSYVVGVSRMRWWSFMVANLLGQAGGATALAYAGAGFGRNDPVVLVIFGATVATAIAFFARMFFLRRLKGAK